MSVEDVHCKTDFAQGDTGARLTKKDILKIAISLGIIYVIGGLMLAFVYSKAAPIVYIKEKKEKEAALRKMMPEAEQIDLLGKWQPHEKEAEYYIAKKGKEGIGYIVQGFGKGYSSYINILVSLDKDFTIEKVNILGHAETPGLGDEIEKDYFLNQFSGKGINNLIIIKGETQDKIQAISGATISSRAVTEDGVRNAVKMLMERLKAKEAKKDGTYSS